MSRETLLEAQEIKTRVFAEDGKVIVPFSQAALAFGVSINKLQDLAGEHKALIIFPREDGMVEVSLKSSVADWRKDLWEEMISSLGRGRSKTDLTKKIYLDLAYKLQWDLGREFEDDIDLLQLALSVLWEQLPDGMQRSLEEKSPAKVRSARGIPTSGV